MNMLTCSLCEHQQPGGEACEVCGKKFAPDVAIAVQVDQVEGLETTHFEADPFEMMDVPGTIDELERTSADPVEVTAEQVADVEPTAAAPVEVGALETVPDVEPTRTEIPGDAPTPMPVQIACRYCKTPAPPDGRTCARCGMKLPVYVATAAPVARRKREPVRCAQCGTKNIDEVCSGCGGLIRFSD